MSLEKETAVDLQKKVDTHEKLMEEGADSPLENGELRINGSTVEAKPDRNVGRQPTADGNSSKSRSFYSSNLTRVILSAYQLFQNRFFI